MATLFLGRRVGPAGFERTVAIKVIHGEHASDPQFRKMFLDEARLSARIQHPNVVHVEELGEEGGELYLVMELIAGVTLADLLQGLVARRAPLPIDVAIAIAAQVADGLHGAHEATDEHGHSLGLVHRDISPQNVLLGSRGHVKVIDFGVAKAAGRLAESVVGSVKGKLAYMAPEQILGLPVDRRTDVFALGVVLWEMLTLRRLFYSPSDAEVMDRVREAKVEPPRAYRPEISPALEAVVLGALAAEPGRRPETAYALRRALLAAEPSALQVDVARIAQLVHDAARDRLHARRTPVGGGPMVLADATVIDTLRSADSDDEETVFGVDVRAAASLPGLEREVELARAGGDPVLLVRALANLAGCLLYNDQLDRAAGILGEADRLVLTRAFGLRALTASLRAQLAAALGDLAARKVAHETAVELFEQAGLPRKATRAAVNLADVLNHVGAYGEAERALDAALARCRQLEMPETEGYALLNLGHALTMLGRFHEADHMIESALAIGARRAEPRLDLFARIYRARLLLEASRAREALAEALTGASCAEERGTKAGVIMAWTIASRAALALTDSALALDLATRAFSLFEQLGALEEGEGELFVAMVAALEAAGRTDEAATIRARARERLLAASRRITDEVWRARFLRDVRAHAALLAS